jgi:hypothetical protein
MAGEAGDRRAVVLEQGPVAGVEDRVGNGLLEGAEVDARVVPVRTETLQMTCAGLIDCI